MTYEELHVFKFIVAVATACMEDERPPAFATTPELACRYIRGILDLALSRFGLAYDVRPMAYPVCSKIPIIISLDGIGDRLFWFYPASDNAAIAKELEGALHDAVQCAAPVPA